ncbi:MAG: PQQ-binding-like beta-propeller repeat protein [Rickettsiales bacterium]
MRKVILLCGILPFITSCSYMPTWLGGEEKKEERLAGKRESVLSSNNNLKVDDDIKNTSPEIPEAVSNVAWSQHNGNFTANTANIKAGNFSNYSSATIGDGNEFSHGLVTSPVVAGGKVFAMDSAGVISAHDAVNIEKIYWKSEIVADSHENEIMGGGLSVSGDYLYASTGQGKIAAINIKDGKKIWSRAFGVPLKGAPRVSGSNVIIVTIDSQTYALNSKDGNILWDHRGISEIAAVMSDVTPTIFGDEVFIPYSSGEMFSLSLATGDVSWVDTLMRDSRSSVDFSGIGGDPVTDKEVVFVTGNNGVTTAISIFNGRRVWQRHIASFNTPLLAGSELFILSSDNVLINMVKYTGKIRWVNQLASYENPDDKEDAISWRGPVMVNGKLLLVGSNGKMIFVSASDGKVIETKQIPDSIFTQPVIAGGRLYLVDKDAVLYSFK